MKTLSLLALLCLTACHVPKGGYRDVRYEADSHAEVPPTGDGTNRANGPVGTGPF